LRLEVACVTGDGDPGEAFRDIAAAHLILTTPEKWDSVTRRWTENFYLLASVKLVLVDEIHLVADKSRGACLESVLNRLKIIAHVAQQVHTTPETIATSSYVYVLLLL
jgi:ATP-dependent DNA helicase HFM1/MER3